MTPTELFGKPADNGTGFVSFDEIENAFKTPTQRQADYDPQPEPSTGSGGTPTPPMGDLGHLADPDGMAFLDPAPVVDDGPETVVSPEKAQRTGMRIARLVDTGIDFALSNFVARNGESYKADERDLQDIGECWGELAQEKGWSIGPEWSLVILYVMVYGPLVKQAITNRRLAELEARQEAMQAQINAMQAQKAMQQPAQPTPVKPANDGNDSPGAIPSPFTYQPQA